MPQDEDFDDDSYVPLDGDLSTAMEGASIHLPSPDFSVLPSAASAVLLASAAAPAVLSAASAVSIPPAASAVLPLSSGIPRLSVPSLMATSQIVALAQ